MNDAEQLIALTDSDLANVDGGIVQDTVIDSIGGPHPAPYDPIRWDYPAPVEELY